MDRKQGFGLLEVLFSTTIFIVVVGSLVSLSRLSLRNSFITTHRSQAFNLAQDALETIRQMRDTNWIDGVVKVSGAGIAYEENEQWLAFLHDCAGSGVSGQVTRYDPIAYGTNYEICFDDTIKRFGLRPAGTDDTNPTLKPDTYLTLVDGTGVADLGSPLWFKRTISFEPIKSTSATFEGLQLLTSNDSGNPLLLTDVEPIHFFKAKVTVEWYDFDRKWSINTSTILSNWQVR